MDDLVLQELQHTWGVRVKNVFRAQDLETIMSLVRSGAGIALGPDSFVRRYGGKAVPIEPHVNVALNLVTLKQNADNSLVRQLRRYLDDYLRTRKINND